MPDTEEALKEKLNQETAKIDWQELQRFYASGSVVAVKSGTDLIAVACDFSNDKKEEVAALLAEGKVYRPDDQQALDWLERKVGMWAVVVAPWVLVQEIT